MHRQPLLHMILALAVVTLAGAMVVGFADYPQRYLVELYPTVAGDPAGPTAPAGIREQEMSCPGPLRPYDLMPRYEVDGAIVWPPHDGRPEPCRYQRDQRQAGTWLALALSALAAVTALALLRRAGPSPDLDPPQPDPLMRGLPDL